MWEGAYVDVDESQCLYDMPREILQAIPGRDPYGDGPHPEQFLLLRRRGRGHDRLRGLGHEKRRSAH